MNFTVFDPRPVIADEEDLAHEMEQKEFGHHVARRATTALGLDCALAVAASLVINPQQWLHWTVGKAILLPAIITILVGLFYAAVYERAADRTWAEVRRDAEEEALTSD